MTKSLQAIETLSDSTAKPISSRLFGGQDLYARIGSSVAGLGGSAALYDALFIGTPGTLGIGLAIGGLALIGTNILIPRLEQINERIDRVDAGLARLHTRAVALGKRAVGRRP